MPDLLTKQDLRDAIGEVAPLVDANKVLREWIYQNGIVFCELPGCNWAFKDNRPGFECSLIEGTKSTYAEALIFAFEFVKAHLQGT